MLAPRAIALALACVVLMFPACAPRRVVTLAPATPSAPPAAFAFLSSRHRPAADLTLVEVIAELEAMADHDRAHASRRPEPDPASLARAAAVDVLHADRLAEIVAVLGWPVPARVGGKAASGALAAAARAHHDPAMQLDLLSACAAATDRGLVHAHDLARMLDSAERALSGTGSPDHLARMLEQGVADTQPPFAAAPFE